MHNVAQKTQTDNPGSKGKLSTTRTKMWKIWLYLFVH